MPWPSALWKAAELGAGAVLAGIALTDVFSSVVAPGRAGGGIRLGAQLSRMLHPLFRRLVRLQRGDDAQDFLGGAAAFLLLAMMAVWVGALLLGFALIAHALRDEFSPPLPDFGDAAFQVGSAIVTLGLSGHTAQGWARPLLFLAGFTGLAVVTLTLTFIIAMQQALERREAVVLAFGPLAGERPSGLDLLLTVAELDLRGRLGDYFQGWSAWAADVAYTHTAHPVLAHFRSRDRDNDWLAALGAMLDAAALSLALVEGGPRGEAQLLLRSGGRLAAELCREYGLQPPSPFDIDAAALEAAAGRLRAAGYATRPTAAARDSLLSLRGRYAGHLAALTDRFSVKPPIWIAPVSAESPEQRL